MRKTEKKFIVILVSLAFLSSGVIASSAYTVEAGLAETSASEITPLTKTVTLYRYGLDGTETPIETTITLEEGKDLDDLMFEKCEELLEKDIEMQGLFSNLTFGVFSLVKSKGRGFHYQTILLGKMLIKFVLSRLGLPRIRTLLRKPLIYCRYPKDARANTTITPMLRNNVTRYMDGPHQVIVLNFVGYTTWCRRFSFTPLNLIPKSFAGFANEVICLRV